MLPTMMCCLPIVPEAMEPTNQPWTEAAEAMSHNKTFFFKVGYVKYLIILKER
jgi:hypothetical protein